MTNISKDCEQQQETSHGKECITDSRSLVESNPPANDHYAPINYRTDGVILSDRKDKRAGPTKQVNTKQDKFTPPLFKEACCWLRETSRRDFLAGDDFRGF